MDGQPSVADIPLLIHLGRRRAAACELVFVYTTEGNAPWPKPETAPGVTVCLVASPKAAGLGGAVKRGLFAAQGDVVIVCERRGPGPQEILAACDWLEKGFDMVLGTVPDGLPGKLFAQFSQLLLDKDMAAPVCAYRIMRRQTMAPVLGRVYLQGRSFDVEWVYLLRRLNCRVKTLSVVIEGEKFLPADLRMFWDVLRMRNWHFPQINLDQPHMSDTEMHSMFEQEKQHWWFIAKGQFMKKIMRMFVRKGGAVLDAGCGTGHNMRFLADKDFYVGLDVSQEALRFCQRNGHGILVRGQLEQLPFAKGSFDVALALDVIEHTQNPWQVIRQLFKVIKPNGTLVVTVPACRFLFSGHDEALSHLRRYDPEDLRQLLSEAGFRVEHLGYMYCLPFIPVAAVRVFRKLFIRDPRPQSDVFSSPNLWINRFMQKLLGIEKAMLGGVPFPFGTTLYAVAIKPKNGSDE